MSDCIFCKIVEGKARAWKVYENESVYAFLDIHPVNEYHGKNTGYVIQQQIGN